MSDAAPKEDPNLYYAALWTDPAFLLPIVYTPTVGEACQKFGLLPFFPRGCYVSISDCGKIKQVLAEYAECMLSKAVRQAFLEDVMKCPFLFLNSLLNGLWTG